MKTLTVEEAAELLKLTPRSLCDKRVRANIGLPGRKVGRRLIFSEADVLRVIEAGKEHLPGREREGRR